MRLLAIDLTENCRLVLGRPASTINCDFRIEGELRAGQHADRGAGIARGGEPAGAGPKIRRSKLVANARRARLDVHQTIIAHGMRLLCSTSVASNARSPSWVHGDHFCYVRLPTYLRSEGLKPVFGTRRRRVPSPRCDRGGQVERKRIKRPARLRQMQTAMWRYRRPDNLVF